MLSKGSRKEESHKESSQSSLDHSQHLRHTRNRSGPSIVSAIFKKNKKRKENPKLKLKQRINTTTQQIAPGFKELTSKLKDFRLTTSIRKTRSFSTRLNPQSSSIAFNPFSRNISETNFDGSKPISGPDRLRRLRSQLEVTEAEIHPLLSSNSANHLPIPNSASVSHSSFLSTCFRRFLIKTRRLCSWR